MKTLKIKRAQAATIPAGHIAIPVEHRLDASDIMNELFFDTLGSDGAPILQSAAAHIAGNHVRRERSTVAQWLDGYRPLVTLVVAGAEYAARGVKNA